MNEGVVHALYLRRLIDPYKRVPGRTVDTKDRTDLPWTNLIDVLESTLDPHIYITRWTPSRTHLHLIAMYVHQLGNLDSPSGARVEHELALFKLLSYTGTYVSGPKRHPRA